MVYIKNACEYVPRNCLHSRIITQIARLRARHKISILMDHQGSPISRGVALCRCPRGKLARIFGCLDNLEKCMGLEFFSSRPVRFPTFSCLCVSIPFHSPLLSNVCSTWGEKIKGNEAMSGARRAIWVESRILASLDSCMCLRRYFHSLACASVNTSSSLARQEALCYMF